MNSGTTFPGCNPALHVLEFRFIHIFTAIYVTILVALGILMLMIEPAGALYEIFPLSAVFFPAAIYATASFAYGHDLFGGAEATRCAHAWSQLLRISAILYCLLPLDVIFFWLFGTSFSMTVRLQDVKMREFETFMQRAVVFMHGGWKTLIVSAVAVGLIVVWARVGRVAFVNERSPDANTGLARSRWVGLWIIAGAALMLGSLALDVGYSSSGWSVITWRGSWVTNTFVAPYALAPWIGSVLFAGYVAGILLALISMAYGVIVLRRKEISPGRQKTLLNISILIAWFTLTSYWGDCLYMAFIGLLGSAEAREFVVITAGWLTMFVVGAVLWLRYGNGGDERSRTIRTGLLVWALPMMPLTLVTFWCAAAWWLYGLILYVAGVQIVAACCWKKIWIDQPLRTRVSAGFEGGDL